MRPYRSFSRPESLRPEVDEENGDSTSEKNPPKWDFETIGDKQRTRAPDAQAEVWLRDKVGVRKRPQTVREKLILDKFGQCLQWLDVMLSL